MKIVSFSVKNYRSIVDAHKIKLKDYNVLIGKNNEGKSNILRALNVCMNCINDYKMFVYGRGRTIKGRSNIYEWERDFPIQLQNRKNGKEIIFDVEFELSNEELSEMNNTLGTRISSNIVVMKIKIGPDNRPNISFPRRGTASLTKKKNEVADFLSNIMSSNFIGTIRTKSYAMDLISDMILKELQILENDKEYIDSVSKIKKMQNDVLSNISKNIKRDLNEFLPKVKDVHINISDDYNLGFSTRDINVFIDDGVLTDIEYKGDGIKSLSVIALFKNRENNKNSSLLAIDEPESHLHPGAIRDLSNNLKSISENNQIIISTHNGSFIDIENISNNIIIDGRIARPAKNVSEIRDVLGIMVEDYMTSTRLKIFVEGETDLIILKKIICEKNSKLKKYFDSKEIVIVSMNSASKLEYHLRLLKEELCKAIVLVDNDQSAKTAIKKEIDNKNIDYKDVFQVICPNMKESEIEDIINPDYYKELLFNKYGININNKKVKSDKKWADRIRECANFDGKYIDENIINSIKKDLADIVEKKGLSSICEMKINSINNLIRRLEELVIKDNN